MRGAKRKRIQNEIKNNQRFTGTEIERQLQAVPNNMFKENHCRKRTLRRAYPCVRISRAPIGMMSIYKRPFELRIKE